MQSPLAFVRSVPDSFPQALRSAGGLVIDVETARVQHRAYVERLGEGGFSVEELDTPAHLSDGVFIEDSAVILGNILVSTRPGAPSRLPEVDGVAQALANRFAIESIVAPGTLDGGDVLRLDRTLFVGRSARTNEEGIAQLAAIASACGLETVAVPVAGTLHLKSVVTALDGTTLIATRGHFDPAVFGTRVHTNWVSGEPEVNVLRLPNGAILVPEAQPAVQEIVAAAGFPVVTVDVSEFEKADGGLTCLSLRSNAT